MGVFSKDRLIPVPTDCGPNCIGKKCGKWVVMYQDVQDENSKKKRVEVGRCYLAWIPHLVVECTARFIGAFASGKNK